MVEARASRAHARGGFALRYLLVVLTALDAVAGLPGEFDVGSLFWEALTLLGL
jgi:hypothetical protein